jgi:repressor LexA
MSNYRPHTARQREVLDAICRLSADGRGPSLRELGAYVGLAGSWATRRHLSILEKRGYIERMPKTPRGIKALPMPTSLAA